jgi:hypothetical protein
MGVGLHPGLRRGRLYVATWAGFIYVALVINTYARRIVGWRPAGRRTPTLSWMRSSRRFMIAVGFTVVAWFIIATAGRKADSIGRRNAVFLDLCGALVKRLGRCSPSQRFARSAITGLGNGREGISAMNPKVGTLGEVLA